MSYVYHHRVTWVASWDGIDETELLSHFHQTNMLTVFSNGTGKYKIPILLEGQKMNSTYSIEFVLCPLTEFCYPQGRGHMKGEPSCLSTTGRFTALRRFQKSLANFGFIRMEHPPYSPDSAPCDFFLFGAMKQAFAGQHLDPIDDLFMGVEVFLGGPSADFSQTVFQEWVQ
jgi:hypothetical protein